MNSECVKTLTGWGLGGRSDKRNSWRRGELLINRRASVLALVLAGRKGPRDRNSGNNNLLCWLYYRKLLGTAVVAMEEEVSLLARAALLKFLVWELAFCGECDALSTQSRAFIFYEMYLYINTCSFYTPNLGGFGLSLNFTFVFFFSLGDSRKTRWSINVSSSKSMQ